MDPNGFRRRESFEQSIPQNFINDNFQVCPLCGSAFPNWALKDSVDGGEYRVMFRCQHCGGVVSASQNDFLTAPATVSYMRIDDGGSFRGASPIVGNTYAIGEFYKMSQSFAPAPQPAAQPAYAAPAPQPVAQPAYTAPAPQPTYAQPQQAYAQPSYPQQAYQQPRAPKANLFKGGSAPFAGLFSDIKLFGYELITAILLASSALAAFVLCMINFEDNAGYVLLDFLLGQVAFAGIILAFVFSKKELMAKILMGAAFATFAFLCCFEFTGGYFYISDAYVVFHNLVNASNLLCYGAIAAAFFLTMFNANMKKLAGLLKFIGAAGLVVMQFIMVFFTIIEFESVLYMFNWLLVTVPLSAAMIIYDPFKD